VLSSSFCLLHFSFASAQDRAYGHYYGFKPTTASSHQPHLASQAGAQILARGGSAIRCRNRRQRRARLTEPNDGRIGGYLFLLYWGRENGKLYGLNASGWAPRNLTIDFLKKQGAMSMRRLDS